MSFRLRFITKCSTEKKKNELTTTCVPELVTLAVALHMCYRALTLSLTQVVAVDIE